KVNANGASTLLYTSYPNFSVANLGELPRGTLRLEVQNVGSVAVLRLLLNDVRIGLAQDPNPLPVTISSTVGFFIDTSTVTTTVVDNSANITSPAISNVVASPLGTYTNGWFAPSTGIVGNGGMWDIKVPLLHVVAGDFNGDHKQDLVGQDSSKNWWVGLSQG